MSYSTCQTRSCSEVLVDYALCHGPLSSLFWLLCWCVWLAGYWWCTGGLCPLPWHWVIPVWQLCLCVWFAGYWWCTDGLCPLPWPCIIPVLTVVLVCLVSRILVMYWWIMPTAVALSHFSLTVVSFNVWLAGYWGCPGGLCPLQWHWVIPLWLLLAAERHNRLQLLQRSSVRCSHPVL